MKLYIFVIVLMAFQKEVFSQRRRFHRTHPHPPFFNQQQFHPFPPPQPQRHQQQFQPIRLSSQCSAIQFLRNSNNQWYGNLILKSSKGVKGANVEIEFDIPVISFVNNFADSTSLDNKIFIIKNNSKVLNRGDVEEINFFVNFNEFSKLPELSKLKFNGDQICPEKAESSGCAKFEMLSNGTGGRWDGILEINGNLFRGGSQIDLEFDEISSALGNDLGDSTTENSKLFTIYNRQQLYPGMPLIINFFIKFNELEKIPLLNGIFIDGIRICLPNEHMERRGTDSTTKPPLNKSFSNFYITDLPFNEFPSVTQIPQQVDNSKFECGRSGNVISSRVNSGSKAQLGQFPFHVAIYFDSRYRCGGNLISEKFIASAAHCVLNSSDGNLPTNMFHLLMGTIDLKSLTGNEAMRKVEKIIKHPEYEYDKILKQDIALIKMQGNLQFTQNIQPICLPESLPSIKDIINQNLTILGFGSDLNSLSPSRFLNYGQMTIISRQQCTDKLFFALLPEQTTFCAKSKDEVVACPGDSGGGIVEIINGKYYLRGISSVTLTEANGKCNLNYPVGFTDVQAFTAWIHQNDKI